MARRRKSSINLPLLIVAVVIILVTRLVSFVGGMIDSAFDSSSPSPTAYRATLSTTTKTTVRPTIKPTSTLEPTYSSLRPGDSGDDVEKLQIRLSVLGFSVGSLDGSYGAKTESAVKEFQRLAGLTADGIAGAKTQAALYAYTAPTAPVSTVASSATNSSTASSSENQSTAAYIGNRNSKKFHHSWCSSVSDMNASNRVPFDSRSEAIDYGYKPCSRCNP